LLRPNFAMVKVYGDDKEMTVPLVFDKNPYIGSRQYFLQQRSNG
jgi:hypothetical protein